MNRLVAAFTICALSITIGLQYYTISIKDEIIDKLKNAISMNIETIAWQKDTIAKQKELILKYQGGIVPSKFPHDGILDNFNR